MVEDIEAISIPLRAMEDLSLRPAVGEDARQRTTFFALPSELRIRIYELLFYHNETGGVICPRRHEQRRYMLLVDGRRYCMDSESGVVFEPDDKNMPPHEQAKRQKELSEEFGQTTNAISGHYCDPHCLLQPELSKVNRQLHEEALATFYGSNHFHFEMSNFEVTTAQGGRLNTVSPTDWWRAIGDTNLRSINHLTMVCHPSMAEESQKNIMLDYRRLNSQTLEVRYIQVLPPEARPKPPSVSWTHFPTVFERHRFLKANRHAKFDSDLLPFIHTVKESGIHVQVLEHLLVWLEPANFEYLRDHMALGDDREVAMLVEGRGEKIYRYGRDRLMHGINV